jgi:hypothetical protein
MFRSEDGHKTETCSGYWIKYSNQCCVRRKPWTWPSTRNRIQTTNFKVRTTLIIDTYMIILYNFALLKHFCPFINSCTFYRTKLGIISVGFDVTDQLLIRFSSFVRYWRKMWVQWDSTSAINMPFGKFRATRWDWNWMGHIRFWFKLMLWIYWGITLIL